MTNYYYAPEETSVKKFKRTYLIVIVLAILGMSFFAFNYFQKPNYKEVPCYYFVDNESIKLYGANESRNYSSFQSPNTGKFFIADITDGIANMTEVNLCEEA